MTQQKKSRKPYHRSPNYPGLALPEAVERAKTIYEHIGKASSPKKAVLEFLGYSSENGAALRTLSALKTFDLISYEEKNIVLTKSACNIIIYSHDQAKVLKELKKLALMPRIFNDIYNKYKSGTFSDIALKAELIDAYNFNPKKVAGFIKNFKATLKHAEILSDDGSFSDADETTDYEDNDPTQSPPIEQKERETIDMVSLKKYSYDIPLDIMEGTNANITFSKMPLQEEDLEAVKHWIDYYGKKLLQKKQVNSDKVQED